MGNANINFLIQAQSGQAVRAFNQLTSSQDKSTAAFERMARKGKNTTGVIDNALSSAKRFGLGLVGASGAVAAVRAFEQHLDNVSGKVIKFETDMKGLFSLGQNVKIMPQLREEVIQLSNASGILAEEIARAKFNIQSGASFLDNQTREDILKKAILLTRVHGGELATNTQAVTKSVNIFQDEYERVADIVSKLSFVADEAAVTIDDLATLFPDVAASAKTFGLSMDEINGGLIVTTQLLGKNERTFTGFRNVITRMSNAQKEGIKLTGDFTKKLERLSKVDPDVLKKIFGDEAIGVISVLTENTDRLTSAIERSQKAVGGLLEGKEESRLLDQTAQLVSDLEKIERMTENIGKNPTDLGMAQLAKRKKLIDLSMKSIEEEGGIHGAATPKWYLKIFDAAVTFSDNLLKSGGKRNLITGKYTSTPKSISMSEAIGRDRFAGENALELLGFNPDRAHEQFRKLQESKAWQGPTLASAPAGPQTPSTFLAAKATTDNLVSILKPGFNKLNDWLAETNEKYQQYQGPLGQLRLQFEALNNTAKQRAENEKKELEEKKKKALERQRQLESMGMGEDGTMGGMGKRAAAFIQPGESVESYMNRTGGGKGGFDEAYANQWYDFNGRRKFGHPGARIGRAFEFNKRQAGVIGPRIRPDLMGMEAYGYDPLGMGHPGINALESDRQPERFRRLRASNMGDIGISRAGDYNQEARHQQAIQIYTNSLNLRLPQEVNQLRRIQQANQIASI